MHCAVELGGKLGNVKQPQKSIIQQITDRAAEQRPRLAALWLWFGQGASIASVAAVCASNSIFVRRRNWLRGARAHRELQNKPP